MTDQTEAPELIWAVSGYGCWQDKPPASGLRTGQWTEYTRKDISDAKDKRIEELEDRLEAAIKDAQEAEAYATELEAERDEIMREALSLVTQWGPLNYPAVVASQIDNMVTGIVARAEAAEAKLAKAEAWVNAALTVSPNIDLDIEAHARAALAELKGSADDL